MNETRKPQSSNSPLVISGLFYGLVAIWGFAQLLVQENAGLYLIGSIAIALPPTIWMIRDAKIRFVDIPHIIQPLILAFWIVVIPVYLVSTRRMKGLGWVVLHFFGTVFISTLAYNLAVLCYWGPSAYSQ